MRTTAGCTHGVFQLPVSSTYPTNIPVSQCHWHFESLSETNGAERDSSFCSGAQVCTKAGDELVEGDRRSKWAGRTGRSHIAALIRFFGLCINNYCTLCDSVNLVLISGFFVVFNRFFLFYKQHLQFCTVQGRAQMWVGAQC